MIIKHIDGTEVDTDKLPDIDAQIFEKTEELRMLCESANRLFLLQIATNQNQKLASFWNFKDGPNPDYNMTSRSFSRLAKCTHETFMMFSNSQIGLYPTTAIDPDKLNNRDE